MRTVDFQILWHYFQYDDLEFSNATTAHYTDYETSYVSKRNRIMADEGFVKKIKKESARPLYRITEEGKEAITERFLGDFDRQILYFLRDHGPADPGEAAAEIGIQESYVVGLFNTLADYGLITEIGDGEFEINDDGRLYLKNLPEWASRD